MKVQDLYGSWSLQRTYKRGEGIEHEASAFHTPPMAISTILTTVALRY
jgi:hypothetical protein